MRYLSVGEVLALCEDIMSKSGGKLGIHNLGGLESAIAQPRMTSGGMDLYPTVVEKAAILGFSVIKNHPFVDGNKRVGHAAMEVFLILNGSEISASVDEQEKIILRVASGESDLAALTDWLRASIVPRE